MRIAQAESIIEPPRPKSISGEATRAFLGATVRLTHLRYDPVLRKWRALNHSLSCRVLRLEFV